MRLFFILISTVSFLLFFGGCAPAVRTEVTTFHNLPSDFSITYKFHPVKGQNGSLEYKTYQKQIREHLNQLPFREITTDDIPDVFIVFNYFIDKGNQRIESVPIYGPVDSGVSTTYGTYGNGAYSATTYSYPVLGVTGSYTQTRTDYGRGFYLDIYDAKHLVAGKGVKLFYEGKVISVGRSASLPEIIPAMIDSLFKNFPGENGKTVRRSMPMD